MTTEKLMRLELDCNTGEERWIELTEEEILEIEKTKTNWQKEQAAKELEREAKAAAKASAIVKLATLGLTEDEAKAIAG